MSVWDRWLRKGPENKYVDLIFEASNCYANWDPLKAVKIGDYGYLQKDGSFVADGNIFDEGLAAQYGIETTKTGEDSIRWIQSVKTKEISGSAQAKVGAAPLVGVGIKKSFKIASSHGAVLVMLKPRLESIKYPGRLKALLTSREDWKEQVVISEVYTCHSYARLLAPKQSSEVEISLDGKTHAGLVGGKTKMQWKTSHEAGDFKCRHGSGKTGDVICYPLYKLVSLRARGPVLRLKVKGTSSRSNSKTVEQPVTPSADSAPDDSYTDDEDVQEESGEEEEDKDGSGEEEGDEEEGDGSDDEGLHSDNEQSDDDGRHSSDTEAEMDVQSEDNELSDRKERSSKTRGRFDSDEDDDDSQANETDSDDDDYRTSTAVKVNEAHDDASDSDDAGASDSDEEHSEDNDSDRDHESEYEGSDGGGSVDSDEDLQKDNSDKASAVDGSGDDKGSRTGSDSEVDDVKSDHRGADMDSDDEDSRSDGPGSAKDESDEEPEDSSEDERSGSGGWKPTQARSQSSDSDND
ncbi:hypothetical protein CERSUDRAFT_112781 [Gelatoporia subvermispora B]|uniref:Uncharacterized protein n=1 Tax=Ceriporiopsis subvermispora (strain B) TaxID=914234 RepID=M2RJV4_CERS8|nr:hypothetical protein CERSUDRAFT_112781 [Gelatoporia subvermispora B]